MNNHMQNDTYKPVDKPMDYGGNNHVSIVEINDQWYIFYHRHTNGSNFSRQACMGPIEVLEDGSIPQVEITSSGPNGGPLKGRGEYPGDIACHLCRQEERAYRSCRFVDSQLARMSRDVRLGADELVYVVRKAY